MLAALSFEIPDRYPLQILYTPEFNRRLRHYYGENGHSFVQEAEGEINTELEFLSGQDMLLAWIGWTDETRVFYEPGYEFYNIQLDTPPENYFPLLDAVCKPYSSYL